MRLLCSLFMMCMVCLLSVWTQEAQAANESGETRVTLRNFTGTDLYALHLAPGGSEKWSEDLLAGNALPMGEKVEVTFPWHARAIWWDIHVENKSGTVVKWTNVPMKRFRVLTLLFDGNQPRIRGE